MLSLVGPPRACTVRMNDPRNLQEIRFMAGTLAAAADCRDRRDRRPAAEGAADCTGADASEAGVHGP